MNIIGTLGSLFPNPCFLIIRQLFYQWLFGLIFLLGREIKVESGLESVEVKLTRGEEPPGGRGGGEGESGSGLLGSKSGLLGSSGGSAGSLLGTSEVSGQETAVLVASIEGIDKGVDSSAVGTVGDASDLAGNGVVGGELGSVGVELEVSVCGVMGVDEGVKIGVDGGISIVVVSECLNGRLGLLGLDETGSGGDGSGLLHGDGSLSCDVGVEGGAVEAVGTGGNVSAVQDSESVLAGSVLYSVCLAVIANVGVLADSLAVKAGLLSEDNAIFLGKSRAETAVTGVESLLLQDLGVLGVDELASGSNGQTRSKHKSKHIWIIVCIFHSSTTSSCCQLK